MVDDKDEKDYSKRVERMRATEDRIGSTDAGLRFLDRIREIGRATPLRQDEDKESDTA